MAVGSDEPRTFEHGPRLRSPRLAELIRSITRTAYYAQKYQESVFTFNPLAILPPVTPKVGETLVQFQERQKAEAATFANQRVEEAKRFHQNYVSEAHRLCALLKADL
jgi:hypothetical protein